MRKILLFTLILSLTAVWLIACGSSSKPVVSPLTKSFVFMRDAGSNLFTPMVGTYTMTSNNTTFAANAVIDTSNGQPVTGSFYSIVLSPDGKKATFDLYGGLNGDTTQWDIFVANVDGTGTFAVTDDTNEDAMPQFSPDGRKVVFTSYRGGNTDQIVIRNVDGTGEQVLPAPLGVDEIWAPTYSPDGSKLAMESWGYDTNENEFAGILIMNAADGSNPQLLTAPLAPDCYCWDTVPAFTADGTKITFARIDNTSSPLVADIYSMNADGTGVTKLTDGVGANFDPLTFTIPGVGERILFSSNRDNLTPTQYAGAEVYSMKTDGTGITQLTNNALFDGFSAMLQDITLSAQVRNHAQHARHLSRPPAHELRW